MSTIAEALSQRLGVKIEWRYTPDGNCNVEYGAGQFVVPNFVNGRHRYGEINFPLEMLQEKYAEVLERMWDAGEKERIEKEFKATDVWEVISASEAIIMSERGGMLIAPNTGTARSFRIVLSPNTVEHVARIYAEHPERHYEAWLSSCRKGESPHILAPAPVAPGA